MASLSHIPTFHSFFSNKPSLFFSSSASSFPPLKSHHRKTCACSIKKPRASKKVKSNGDLCNDIREFLSLVGLPEDHVPTTKELSQHGRQDLANIVRRRGYKTIRELLATSASTVTTCVKEGSSVEQDAVHDGEDKSTGQKKKITDPADDVSLTSDAGMMENHINSSQTDGELKSSREIAPEVSYESFQEKVANFTQNAAKCPFQNEKMVDLADDALTSGTATQEQSISRTEMGREPNFHIYPEASFYSSLQEKADKFVQNGQLDTTKDSDFGITNERSYKDHQVEDPIMNYTASRNGHLSPEISTIDYQNEDLHAEHQKELELIQLKQEIENEKLALTALQLKAEQEISKAQKLISEKDAELLAAEESLSGLKEVEIQYLGDGEIVEVSGSFNGWHQRIKMDPKQSSNIIDSAGPRKSRLWSTDLWLYPGVYEIKFIVDGQWKIDPQRDSVFRGSIHNNILRVDR